MCQIYGLISQEESFLRLKIKFKSGKEPYYAESDKHSGYNSV